MRDKDEGGGELAQLVKCLPRTRENLNLIPRHNVGKPSMPVYVYNPSPGEGKTGKFPGLLGQPA